MWAKEEGHGMEAKKMETKKNRRWHADKFTKVSHTKHVLLKHASVTGCMYLTIQVYDVYLMTDLPV